jgi:hypothetical protein
MARFKVKLKATAVRDPKQDHPTYRIVDPAEWYEFFGDKGIAKRRSLWESRSEDGEFRPSKMTKGICLHRQTPPTPTDLRGTPAKPVTIVCDAKQLEQLEHDRLNLEIISSEPVADDAQLGLVENDSHSSPPPDVSRQDKRSGRSA